MLNHAMKRPMPSTSCGFLFPLRVLSRTHGTYLFTFQNLLRAQFRVHSFAPECCYLCVCRWNLCVCYFPGPSNFTHTHIHKCTLDTNLAYTQNCVSNIVASSSLLPTNSLARHADAAARREGGRGEMAAKFKVSMRQICSQSTYKQEAGD